MKFGHDRFWMLLVLCGCVRFKTADAYCTGSQEEDIKNLMLRLNVLHLQQQSNYQTTCIVDCFDFQFRVVEMNELLLDCQCLDEGLAYFDDLATGELSALGSTQVIACRWSTLETKCPAVKVTCTEVATEELTTTTEEPTATTEEPSNTTINPTDTTQKPTTTKKPEATEQVDEVTTKLAGDNDTVKPTNETISPSSGANKQKPPNEMEIIGPVAGANKQKSTNETTGPSAGANSMTGNEKCITTLLFTWILVVMATCFLQGV